MDDYSAIVSLLSMVMLHDFSRNMIVDVAEVREGDEYLELVIQANIHSTRFGEVS